MDNLENIIKENERLIYSIVNYFSSYKNKDDLYQAGCLGLIKAYKKFNPNLNCKFTTYAYPYILGEIRKQVREDKGLKISRDITKLNLKIDKAYILLTQKLMREPSVSEVSNFLEIPEYYVSEAILSLNKIKSMDEPVNYDNEYTYSEIIGKSTDIDELILLRDSLNKLSKDDRSIIEKRYIDDFTQNEVSHQIGISQVQVSRKEKKILQKLKQEMM